MAGHKHIRPAALALAAALTVAGPALAADTAPAAKAPPANLQGLQEVGHSALDSVHIRPGVNLATYKAVRIEPVQVALAGDRNRPEPQERDVRHARTYFQEKLAQALGGRATNQAGPGTLSVAVTVTRFVPNRPAFPEDRDGRWITESVGVGAAAFTAEVKDAATGQVVAVISDADVGLPLDSNMRTLTEWGDADHFVRKWSQQLAAILTGAPSGS
ncbi:MAG TPA: DUF3313 family protein [Azospirillaceae bacterium]|nr:DUF3313 family protein [Azospirillaceae bacterium]